MYFALHPSQQQSQSTRPGAYSWLLSFLNMTSGVFAGNQLEHTTHLNCFIDFAMFTRVPCTMGVAEWT